MRGFVPLMQRFVILHNIRSAHNVGSIFRTADGAGISKIYLIGYTPTPVDRFGRVQPEIKKTSLGASEMVPWEYVETIESCLDRLHTEGVSIVAVEQTQKAIDYRKFSISDDVAFVFGNERDGVPDSVSDRADATIMIPMQGKKESLNVSVAAGIILFNFG